MKRRILAHLATVSILAPLAILGMSGEAAAAGPATWKNARTGKCLYTTNGMNGVGASADYCNNKYGRWYEKKLGNGAYRMWVVNNQGAHRCLDSDKEGDVYLRTCEDGNRNQQWYQVRRSTGWRLTNVATGRVLDSNFRGSVYTNFDEGDRNTYQRWL
ncbi:Actinohivin [Streptomyces sp. enrichment culture]|uniref:RICIN domain-containing protein n=1 Tax=Streptomyces sp. enrichment culture TaxID=1795815 RepID=UPI003F5506E0